MSLSPATSSTAEPPLAAIQSRQMLRVISADWPDQNAQLQRFERRTAADPWLPVGDGIRVALGKSGMAWGLGLHAQTGLTGPQKREGDGCAPAGMFGLTAAFGYATADSPFAQALKLPYLCATDDLKCIDDPASRHYNLIVDQSCLEQRDWTSSEDMRRRDQRYALGAVVAHNSQCSLPGAGSCIFLHVWESETTPTAGCTAMPFAAMNEVITWLDAAAMPVLLQLPLSEYEHWRAAWRLP